VKCRDLPATIAGRQMSLLFDNNRLSKDFCFGRDQVIYDPWHYDPALMRKPGALRNGAPFKGWALPGALGRVDPMQVVARTWIAPQSDHSTRPAHLKVPGSNPGPATSPEPRGTNGGKKSKAPRSGALR
jgi:hypothetical protein